jgi:hypothetical protein
MVDPLTLRVKAGDSVRVHYHPPGQVMSFVEGVVNRVNLTSTRGPGFLIDITRDVFLSREQPVRPGYQHYVLYERPEGFLGQVEVLSQVQSEAAGYLENGSGCNMEEQPEAEPAAASEPEPKPLTTVVQRSDQETTFDTDTESEDSQVEVEREDGRRRGSLIASIFRRQR